MSYLLRNLYNVFSKKYDKDFYMQQLHLYKQDTVDRIILLQKIVDKKIFQYEAALELDLSERQKQTYI